MKSLIRNVKDLLGEEAQPTVRLLKNTLKIIGMLGGKKRNQEGRLLQDEEEVEMYDVGVVATYGKALECQCIESETMNGCFCNTGKADFTAELKIPRKTSEEGTDASQEDQVGNATVPECVLPDDEDGEFLCQAYATTSESDYPED